MKVASLPFLLVVEMLMAASVVWVNMLPGGQTLLIRNGILSMMTLIPIEIITIHRNFMAFQYVVFRKSKFL
jgi:hypothetical protein